MMRVLCAVSLLAVLVVAPPSNGTGHGPDSLSFFGCHTQFGGFPTTIETARSLAPPGFEAAPFSVDPSGQTGSWAVYVHRCARAEADDGLATGPVQQAWVLLRVLPPGAWADPDVNGYFVVLNGVTDHALVSDTYAAWGVSRDGTAIIEALPAGPDPAFAGQAASVSGDGMDYTFVNAPTAGSSPWGPFTARLFGVGADGAVHAADHVEPAGGRISQIEGAVVTLTEGGGALAGAHTGLGRVLSWPSDALSWTVRPVDAPA